MPNVTQEARRPTEGGLMGHRIEFVREDEIGVPPADPDWQLYSDVMTNAWAWAPDASVEAQRGISHIDPQEFFGGPVENEFDFEYHWQRPWTDGTGTPLDASHDFFFRDDYGLLHATHTVVGREEHPAGGTTGAGFYTYTVALGAYPSEAEAEADAGESMPIPMSLTYQAEKVTTYVINQPAAATKLVVSSDDGGDTQEVTIEAEGAATAETVTLDGTNNVSTGLEFGSVDAVWVSPDAVGDVTVSVNDGTESSPTVGDTLTEIEGRDTHSPTPDNDLEGDQGVPPLGAGSHEGEIAAKGSRTWQHFRGDRIERVAGAQIGPRLNSSTLSVDNNVDSNERQPSRRMAIDRGIRDLMIEGSIAGPQATHQVIMDHLKTRGADVEWEFMTDQLLRVPAAVVTEPGERSAESEGVTLYVDSTLQGNGAELTDGAGTVLAD
jgi:hypothetical protein